MIAAFLTASFAKAWPQGAGADKAGKAHTVGWVHVDQGNVGGPFLEVSRIAQLVFGMIFCKSTATVSAPFSDKKKER